MSQSATRYGVERPRGMVFHKIYAFSQNPDPLTCPISAYHVPRGFTIGGCQTPFSSTNIVPSFSKVRRTNIKLNSRRNVSGPILVGKHLLYICRHCRLYVNEEIGCYRLQASTRKWMDLFTRPSGGRFRALGATVSTANMCCNSLKR